MLDHDRPEAISSRPPDRDSKSDVSLNEWDVCLTNPHFCHQGDEAILNLYFKM
jgi:hypothetical protein